MVRQAGVLLCWPARLQPDSSGGRRGRRRAASACVGPPTPKAAPLHLQRPQRHQSLRRLRGRSGRRPGEGTRPPDRVRPVRLQEPDLGPAAGRLRLRHERRGSHARPRQGASASRRPYYVYSPATGRPGRRDRVRFAGGVQASSGGVVGTLEDTAAERLLDQMGVVKKVYGNQVEPYVDLELGRLDAVLLDLPIAAYYAKPNPKLQVRRPADRPGLSTPSPSARTRRRWPRSSTPPWTGWPSRATLRRIYEKWHIWNDHQERLARRRRASNDVLRESGRHVDFCALLPPAAGRGRRDGGADVFEHVAGDGARAADRAGAAVRPGPAAAGGHGLRRVLPRHSRAAAAVLPLLRTAGDRRDTTICRSA